MAENSITENPDLLGFVQAWCESVSQVLTQIAGAPLSCQWQNQAPAELASVCESDLWFVGTASGAVRGEMSLRLNAASALRGAQLLMSLPPDPAAEIAAEHREATLEMLRQFAGLASGAMKARWGEVQLHLEAASGPPSWPASVTVWLAVGEGELSTLVLEFRCSAALVSSLKVPEKPEASSATDATISSSAPIPRTDNIAVPGDPKADDAKLSLLMDVELALMLRFGGRRLLLREILELSPGAVVELDRQVHEPVDMLLDGKLIARGEVVVIEGNYGLRVTEIARPREH